jgi:hypothetical protein
MWMRSVVWSIQVPDEYADDKPRRCLYNEEKCRV